MSTTNDPEFDWSQAESLLGEDPENVPEDMGAIVIELIEGSEERFAELAKKTAGSDDVAIAALAHQLRGSLLNFGFTAVGGVLLQIEKKTYPPADYAETVKKAHDTFLASKALLARKYPSIKLP